MHAEIFQGRNKIKGGWFWHLRTRNGRIVADAEPFPTRANAMRAAKACVTAVCAKCFYGYRLSFLSAPDPKRPGVIIVRWS